jgi:predicted O-methyltransferase YrrM
VKIPNIRWWSRTAYYRFELWRSVTHLLLPQKLKTNHLSSFQENNALGPIQRDEALFLMGLIRVLRPSVILEFGFADGHSAFNFLQAMDDRGELFSFDVADGCARLAKAAFSGFDNFYFIQKSQGDFEWDDIGRRLVDFVFIDASHNLELNQKTFQAILPSLSETAIIGVHDTGAWAKEHFGEAHKKFADDNKSGKWLTGNEYAHEPDERKFVNWIGSQYPEFQVIHCHSKNCIRHGITLLQKNRIL